MLLLAPPPRPRPPEAPALELPDLDSSEDAGEVDVGVFELDMGGDLDDDELGGALDAFEVAIQEQIDPGSNEAASDLDIGETGLIGSLPEVPVARDDDEQAAGGAELDWQLQEPLESDDPSTDAELGDDGLEALPELLADDDEGDAGPDGERGWLAAAPEGVIPPGPSYEPEWVVLGSSCSALWTNGTQVLACAEHLMQFGQERMSVPLPEGTVVSALTRLSSGAVMIATARGLLELSAGNRWATPDPPEGLRGSGATVSELVATAGAPDLWLRLTTGTLLRRRSGLWERHEAGGQVRSLSCTQTRVTLLVMAGRPTLQLSADAGSSFRELLLPEPAETVALGAAPMALAAERTLAIFDAERGLCVSSDAGETFRMVTGAVNITAVAIGEHDGAPAVFAALHREGRDVSEIILVDPRTGNASSVAELAGEADEDTEETGLTRALIYADGHLWAAGGYGLAKLKP